MKKRVAKWLLNATLFLFAVIFIAWAVGALLYDFPFGKKAVAAAFLLITLGLRWGGHGRWKKATLLPSMLVLCWWLSLKPSNHRHWQPDVERTATAEIHGDVVTFHNVRNFIYRTETDYTPRWESREVHLSHLAGLDVAINYWGSPWMAHPIACFRFTDSPPICFSIETRKEVGESYSAIGGIYRQYELSYIIADERDVVRVRTNYRTGEDVYLYRLSMPVEQARQLFLQYIKAANTLSEQPRWYNAITTNCTTSIREQRAESERLPWDWRMLVNGKGDEMMYERGQLITSGLSFPELKARSRINDWAKAADSSPNFSEEIRRHLP